MTMCCLLVVDDDETLRESLAAIPSAFGHNILHARNSLEAFSVYKAIHDKIHLVLMDIMMPRMDGIAAAKDIKKGCIPV